MPSLLHELHNELFMTPRIILYLFKLSSMTMILTFWISNSLVWWDILLIVEYLAASKAPIQYILVEYSP